MARSFTRLAGQLGLVFAFLLPVFTFEAVAQARLGSIEIVRDHGEEFAIRIQYDWLGADGGAYLAVSAVQGGSYKPIRAKYGVNSIVVPVPGMPGLTRTESIFAEIRETGTHRLFRARQYRYAKNWGASRAYPPLSVGALRWCVEEVDRLAGELGDLGKRVGFPGPYNPVRPYSGYRTNEQTCRMSLRDIKAAEPEWRRKMAQY